MVPLVDRDPDGPCLIKNKSTASGGETPKGSAVSGVHLSHRDLGQGAIRKRGDFDSTIRSLPATTCDKMVEDPRNAFNFAGKIHLPTTVSGESSVSEHLAPDALEN